MKPDRQWVRTWKVNGQQVVEVRYLVGRKVYVVRTRKPLGANHDHT